MKHTKIVCTIGPASWSEETLKQLVVAGMNVARLNFSHGTHAEHAEFIRRIRKVALETGEPVAVLQDLQGPKIRVGDLPKQGVELKAGGEVTFTTAEASIPDMRLPVTYEKLHQDVKAGERILLDDGLMSAKVKSINGQDVICDVIDGGILTSHKGVNFPDSKLTVSSLSEKDRKDVAFGVTARVDWMALSFVRSAKEIEELRALIKAEAERQGVTDEEAVPTRIIAKIEKPQAVENMDEIIAAVDAIMVARGDLGIEMPAEEVPIIQKRLIAKCLAARKPVIVATQMLDSMIRNPRPTRAEVSDVANAVIDHTDAVMLSGESAGGKYPVESVEMMSKIVSEIEDSVLDDLDVQHRRGDAASNDEALMEIANILARDVKAELILVVSRDGGRAAGLVSHMRPELPIYAPVPNDRLCHQMNLVWGLKPFVLEEMSADAAVAWLTAHDVIKAGQDFILVENPKTGVGSVALRKV